MFEECATVFHGYRLRPYSSRQDTAATRKVLRDESKHVIADLASSNCLLKPAPYGCAYTMPHSVHSDVRAYLGLGR